MQEVNKFNLKILLSDLFKDQPAIMEVYLFGSRAYRTDSLRSDCDLIVRADDNSNVRSSDLRNFAIRECPALDFFISEGARATSCMNDSFVRAGSFCELVSKLDAILLWSKKGGFTDFEFNSEAKWVFDTSIDMVYVPTVLPSGNVSELSWQAQIKKTEQRGLPVRPYIGDSIDKATAQITEIAQNMIFNSRDLGQKGKAKDGWTVNLSSEYDCQNLFYSIVKPWLPQLGREEVEVIFDGQKKKSDFNLFEGKLIIELKYIDSKGKKNEVVKTLDGLFRFYSRNSNVSCLLFLVYVTASLPLDDTKWEADYSFFSTTPRVITKIIRLP